MKTSIGAGKRPYNLTLDIELQRDAVACASAAGESLSGLVSRLLIEHLRAEGYYLPPKPRAEPAHLTAEYPRTPKPSPKTNGHTRR